jgi:hypothetical protein
MLYEAWMDVGFPLPSMPFNVSLKSDPDASQISAGLTALAA